MRSNFSVAWASLGLLVLLAQAAAPLSNCLGNCIACSDNNPLLCRPLLNTTSAKEYSCLPYYTGSNCQNTAPAYYNMYNETGNFLNWSLPLPPPSQSCKLIPSAASNSTQPNASSFTAIGPFSASYNATKALSFSAAQNVQRLVIKIAVAVADAVLYNGTLYANETTTESVDAEGNIIIETVSINAKNSTLTRNVSFLTLAVTDLLNSNALIASFPTSYSAVSITNTSCGFVYQYEFVVNAASASNPLRQVRLNFYLPSGSQTTWSLLSFSAEGGCSGFAVSTGGSVCSTCLSGFYPVADPDGALQGCSVCDYRCSTCSSASACLLCESYTSSPAPGTCEYPSSFGVYRSFTPVTGKLLNLSSPSSSQFWSVASSQAQALSLGLNLASNQSYLIKFHLLYSLAYADGLSKMDLTVNGKPFTSYSSLELLSSTFLQEANAGAAQLYSTAVKVDLIGKPCLSNFSIGLKGSSSANQEFFVANLVLVQYSCGENCLSCVLNSASSGSCSQCMPFFSLAQSCKACANGFYLRDGTVCVKCYSNCKQCRGPALSDCTDCLAQFALAQMTYDRTCASCLHGLAQSTMKNCDSLCPRNYTLAQLNFNKNCTACLQLSENELFSAAACQSCWVALGLGSGKCVPQASSGFVFYANDLVQGQANSSLWKGSESLSTINCTSDYINLLGIAQGDNHTAKTPATLTYSLGDLPSHHGLIVVLNIFKVDDWLSPSGAPEANLTAITVTVSSPGAQNSVFFIQLSNQFGSNICGGSGREMIWALQADVRDHTAAQVSVAVAAADQGLFVREVEVYLGNCAECDQVGLGFDVFALPMYSDNSSQTGLDVWLTFNHPLSYAKPNSSDAFARSFQFNLDGVLVPNASLTSDTLAINRQLKYFLPLHDSYSNATLTVNTTRGDLVYTTDGTVSRQLVSSSEGFQVVRFDDASLDTRKSTSQLSSFFHFFSWFTLIVMIVCVMLGVGVVFEEFSMMLQLIYYHIYITSALLPPTIKVPLANAVRMEHLNYFADIAGIERGLFGGLQYPPAEPVFQQFNVDVYFLRSVYPLLIINAVFVGWFLVHVLLYRLVGACRNSEHKLLRFIRSIPQRPLAYFDQIWRYQFLALMWACMMQFTNFSAAGGTGANLAACVLGLVIGLAWPVAVTVFTYLRHHTTNVNHFRYSYHDLYYLKISSVADEPKYYLYVGVRFGKLLAYAVFIALFVNQSIIGPVLLIFFNVLEAAVAYFLDIYRSGYYLFTRVVENLLLCISALLCLIIYGNGDSFDQESYENLGYGLATVFVLMVINGLTRFFYLVYKKAYEWKMGTYDIGEVGEKEDYDGKGPIRLAQSERV